MARELTSTQQANVEAGATRPIYLVEWKHSGTTEYLSCSGDVSYGDGSPIQTYTAGGITIAGLEDSKTATLILPATAARVTEIQNNTWRRGHCKITAILAAPGDSPVYAAADGLLVLDGLIESSSFSGESITVIAKSKYYTGALLPRFTYDDVVTSAPAVGTVSTWEGENYSYEQWLKTVAAIQRLVRPGVNPQVTGRPSVSQINSFEPIENPGQKLVTSQGQPIPIVYGRASVAGYVFAEGEYSGSKFVGVAWCMGRINSIESVFINDEAVPSTVTAKHYLGTTTQTVSPALQLYTGTSPQFSDDMILRTAAGDIGIAYSVFNIPASAISGAPRFRAIIQGRLVPDPESTSTDPYEDYVEWSFNFLTGTTDSGPNAYTLTLNGGAAIASPSIGLELDGTGDYATIPDGNNIGSDPFTLEIELQCDTAVTSPGTVETILCKGSTASPLSRSIQIDRVGNEVLLYLSSDGSTWDIANGLSCGTLDTTGSPEVTGRLLVERVGNQISTYMDGATQTGVVTSAALYNNGSVWEIGARGGSQELNGRVRSVRLTIGQYRYGSPHSITNTPFSDSGDYQTGYVYSDNPALCWADLASDPVIGLGATTTGVQLAREYCDSPMDSGAPRCRIGLAITESRLVEAWLDQLAMYSNALWFPEGSDLKIIADRSQADGLSGSGPELYSPTSPEFGSPLPTVTTETGVEYSISFRIDTAATTSPIVGVSVWFDGAEVIASATTVGSHGVVATASGTSSTVQVVPDGGFNGSWSGLSVKRTHRSVTQWLPSTLSIQGTPEGDKPNAVEATYNIPSDTSGAWQQNTFPVINVAAAVGDPIVLTKLSLPGVNRIEEASNKAIATLYRNDNKTRVSLISTDEEFVAQPGDTIQVTSSYRGVDNPVWVESNQMVSYGRHQITGIVYRDNQYPDTDYTTPRKFDETGPPIEEIGHPDDLDPACYPWDCAAYEDWLEEQGLTLFEGSNKTAAKSWKILGETSAVPWPFSVDDGDDGKHILVTNFVAAPNDATSWGGTTPSSSPVAQDIFTDTVSDKTFCTGTLSGMGSLNGDASQSGYISVTPAATRNGGPTSAIWGNHYMSALIMGHNIGTTGDKMSGSLTRVSGKNWRVERNTGFSTITYESDPGTMGVSISTSGSDVTITLYCNNSNTQSAAHPTPVTFTVVGAATELHLVQTYISTGVITTGLGADGKYNTKREVTIRCNYAGSSGTLNCTQWYNLRTTPDYPIISLTPWYPAGSSNLWQQYFIDTVINIAAFSAGTVSDDFDFDVHTYAERMAWDRNNALYLPPGWCPAYSPP